MTNVSNEAVENKKSGSGLSNVMAGIAIVACLVVGYLIWKLVLGNPGNFQHDDPTGDPVDGNLLGMMYKGGIVIAALIGLLTMSIVFGIERFVVVNKASGKGNNQKFVTEIESLVSSNQINEAIDLCDSQQGSVANVVRAALIKYQNVQSEDVNTTGAIEAIHKEIEEATVLEMPMLEKNMIILATLVSIGTLVGLLGTVTGMIKAFSALATAGSPDSTQLANGISEALMNTATGILTSTLSIVFYNIFTTKIDKLTHFIDEAGFAITQAYKRKFGN